MILYHANVLCQSACQIPYPWNTKGTVDMVHNTVPRLPAAGATSPVFRRASPIRRRDSIRVRRVLVYSR